MDNTNPKYALKQFPEAKQFIKLMEEFDLEGKLQKEEGSPCYCRMFIELEKIKAGD